MLEDGGLEDGGLEEGWIEDGGLEDGRFTDGWSEDGDAIDDDDAVGTIDAALADKLEEVEMVFCVALGAGKEEAPGLRVLFPLSGGKSLLKEYGV